MSTGRWPQPRAMLNGGRDGTAARGIDAMKLNRTLGLLAGTSAALVLGSLANARPTYTSAGSGNWATGGTWTQTSSSPVGEDVRTIQSGHTVTITGQEQVAQLTVASGGVLLIDGSGSPFAELNFTASGTPSLSIVGNDGVRLVDNARLRISKTMSITGAGSLQGQDNAVEVAIDTDDTTAVTLTVDVVAEGGMAFKKHDAGTAAANLINSNQFLANVSGLIINLDSSLNSLDDDASALQWYVAADGASMVFNEGTLGLQGHFQLDSNGLFVFNSSVTTTGTFAITCGSNSVEVDVNSATFRYAGGIASENCNPNPPANQIATDYDCICQ
jgi:hypothetical protein